MTHPTRAFSGSIINRFTGSKILARVGQISVAFPLHILYSILMVLVVKYLYYFVESCTIMSMRKRYTLF